eukprot:3516468-Pleurochrysis_carterae.AAC.2
MDKGEGGGRLRPTLSSARADLDTRTLPRKSFGAGSQGEAQTRRMTRWAWSSGKKEDAGLGRHHMVGSALRCTTPLASLHPHSQAHFPH